MPPLTRAAARATSIDVDALGLRANVSRKASAVWRYRGTDLYTGRNRDETLLPQVDHCIEVQLAEMAIVHAYESVGARPGSMATAQAHALLRDALNDTSNLNVTTRAINSTKRGPFTAAISRLGTNSLRDVTLEQLARQGKACALVDSGTWARIEAAIVNSYEHTEEKLNGAVALPAATTFTATTMDELSCVLHRLGVL